MKIYLEKGFEQTEGLYLYCMCYSEYVKRKAEYVFHLLTLKRLNYLIQINLNFQPLEVVSRYRDPQLHLGANYSLLVQIEIKLCKF